MAFPRIPVLRNLLNTQLRNLGGPVQQRRWAQVHDVRFLATTQASRTVLEKYREKLDRKAREEGHAGIQELKQAYADKIHEVRKRDGDVIASTLPPTPPATPPPSTSSSQATPTPGPITPQSAAAHDPFSSGSGVKPLSSILDLPKARTLPIAELTAIWRLRHAHSPQSLCAVIPQHTYENMEALARKYPQFVLPVPHPEQGAEIHFLQWTWDASTATSTVLFTQLAEYKARGEFAAPHTTVTHHLDFVADKKVVLMQGQVVSDRGVKADDARWLVMCLQRFYGGWDGEGVEPVSKERAEERRQLLEWFGKGDTRFSVEKLLEEAERMA